MVHLFGDAELDVEAYELRRGGCVVPLQPKVLEVLRYLVEHPDRVIDKDELLDALWPTEVVNESAVGWCVSHARRALGQGKGVKGPIETVHGRGYRFRPPPPAPAEAAPVQGASISASAPFVGRQGVIERLDDALDHAEQGRGAVIVLRGDAGIGKTRCAEEMSTRARSRRFSVWVGRCPEEESAPALWPLVQVLRSAAADADPRTATTATTLLSDHLTPGRSSGSPDEFWVLDRVAGSLLEAASAGPRLVVVDDIQWADRASVRALALLAPDVGRAPLVVVLTLRDPLRADGEVATMLRRLLRHAEVIPLPDLELDDVREYVTRLSGHAPREDLLHELVRRTTGNPLLVRETIELLAGRVGPHWPSDATPSQIALPEVGRDLIRSRLLTLGEDERRVLTAASVIGDSFALPVLERVTALAGERLLAALDQLERSHVFVELPGIGRYSFTHALLREVLYEDLPRAERAPLHARVADALSREPEVGAGELAYHHFRSLPVGDRDLAIEHARAAGRQAFALFAYDEATRYFEWAIEASRYGADVDPAIVAELHIERARSARHARHPDDARRHLTLAIDIARRHGLGALLVRAGRRLRSSYAWRTAPDPLARQALQDALHLLPETEVPLRIQALAELAGIPPTSLRREESRALSDRALSLARPLGGRALVDALRSRIYSTTGPDDLDDLLDTAHEIVALEAGVGRTWISADALYAQIGALLMRGDLAAAEAALAEFGDLAQSLQLAEALWHHDRLAAQIAYARGELERAESAWTDLAARSSRLGLEYGRLLLPTHLGTLASERTGTSPLVLAGEAFDHLWEWMKSEPRHRSTMARLLLQAGRRQDAARELATLVDEVLPELEHDYHYLWILANLATVAAELQDAARARSIEHRLAPYPGLSAVNSFQFTLGATDHYLGLLAECRGDREAAVRHLEGAIRENTRMQLPVQLAKSQAELGRLLVALGRNGEALSPLGQAEAAATRLGLAPVANRIRQIRSTPIRAP